MPTGAGVRADYATFYTLVHTAAVLLIETDSIPAIGPIDGLALTVSRFGWKMYCTLAELAPIFGLGHADSVRNLTRRVDRALPDSGKLRQDIAAIRQQLPGTERI